MELKKFRNQFEETTDGHEKEIKNLNNQISDLNRQKESALKEVPDKYQGDGGREGTQGRRKKEQEG